MRALTLRVEHPQITINGQAYDLRLSDMEIYTRAQALLERFTHLDNTPPTPDTALTATRETIRLIEEILGSGAALQISEGHPIRFSLAVEWLSTIAAEAAAHYVDTVLEDA